MIDFSNCAPMFFPLASVILDKETIIVAITIVAALGSLIFALTTPRIYKAETLLLPPKEKDYQN